MFVDLKQVGKYTKYRADGSIAWHSTFNDEGKQIGTHWGFWRSGEKMEEIPYEDGVRKGLGGYFHEHNGEPSIVRFWEHDLLQGRSKFFWDIGKLHIVHILKDNRILDLMEAEYYGDEVILR